MINEAEEKVFNHSTCPWYGAIFDVGKDLIVDEDRQYKCHECNTTYELKPIICGFLARRLERGETPPLKDAASFLADREKRIKRVHKTH